MNAEEWEHVGPSVCGVSFSPDGQLLLANVQAELCSELRVVAALDGRQLFNVRFEGVCSAVRLNAYHLVNKNIQRITLKKHS